MIGVHNITLLVQLRVRVWEQGDIALGSARYRPGLLLGGLSPPAFKSGGAQAPPAPPISPPLLTHMADYISVVQVQDGVWPEVQLEVYMYSRCGFL